jgi:hypothetical protein
MINVFLTNLNNYSNLLLVIITAIYVFLTWRMVSEMRQAREAENEPQLVSSLIPLGAMLLKLRISNVGRGPALNIKAVIRLESSKDHEEVIWSHPLLLSNGHEDFRLPGDNKNNYLDKLASSYDKLIVELQWQNSFQRRQDSKYVIDLKQQLDGWTNAKFLVHPDDISVQLGKIKDELTHIKDYFQKQENRQIFRELEEQAKKVKQKPVKRKK